MLLIEMVIWAIALIAAIMAVKYVFGDGWPDKFMKFSNEESRN